MDKEEEKLPDEEVEKVYEAIFNRVKRVFLDAEEVIFIAASWWLAETGIQSKALGVEIKRDGFVDKKIFRVHERGTGGWGFILVPELSKRNAVESFLDIAREHDVMLASKVIVKRKENAESILLEEDLEEI